MQMEEEMISLLREIANRMSVKMNQIYAPYGLTAIQFEILTELYINGSQTMSTLAKQRTMSNSNLSAIIKRLEVHGFVKRERDMMDQRNVHVELCKPALELLEQIKSDARKQEKMFKQCSEQDYADILLGLKKLNMMLKEWK